MLRAALGEEDRRGFKGDVYAKERLCAVRKLRGLGAEAQATPEGFNRLGHPHSSKASERTLKVQFIFISARNLRLGQSKQRRRPIRRCYGVDNRCSICLDNGNGSSL